VKPINRQSENSSTAPVLFAAIGEYAVQTLAELARLVRQVPIRPNGAFGLVILNHPTRQVFVSDCQQLSDLEIPEVSDASRAANWVNYQQEKLAGSLISLIRKLRLGQAGAAEGFPQRVRVWCYLIADLSEPAAVASAVELTSLLRKADPSLDITGLGLTGRTADSLCQPEKAWFDTWNQLLQHLQNEALLQRFYLIDGRDTDNAWLQTPQQMHRLGAEFLLFHGLSPYRGYLRQNERSRVGFKENFLNFCGSFSCRTLTVDRETVVRRTALILAEEDLADLAAGVVGNQWSETIETKARELADEILHIYLQDNAELKTQNSELNSLDHQVDEALQRYISQICAQSRCEVSCGQPVLSLRRFLYVLRDRLKRLSTGSTIRQRAATRTRLTAILRRQEKETYEPVRQWLGVEGARWSGRYKPQLDQPPSATVSRPPSFRLYALGAVLLATGLLGIASALMAEDRIFAIGGGLLALAASVVMALPTGWAEHVRTLVAEGKSIPDSAPWTAYRRKRPRWSYRAAMALLVPGITAVILALFLPGWTKYESLEPLMWLIPAAALASLGLVALTRPTRPRVPPAPGQEMPGHAAPVRWLRHGIGLSALATAWVVLCLHAPVAASAKVALQWQGLLAGLIMVLLGLGLARWPWTGRVQLIYRIPRNPLPLAALPSVATQESELTAQLNRLLAWLHRFTESEISNLRSQVYNSHCTALDAIMTGWDSCLADNLRSDLKARPEKSLRKMAHKGEAWAQCLLQELASPSAESLDLVYAFALHAVRSWVGNDATWHERIAQLQPDPEQFDLLINRIASPHWPATRVKPDMDVSVVAVGETLRPLVSSLPESGLGHHVVPLGPRSDPYAVVVIRIVQGLVEGWRGLPAMPGQIHREPSARSSQV